MGKNTYFKAVANEHKRRARNWNWDMFRLRGYERFELLRRRVVFRLAATLGIVVFNRHFSWTNLCSCKWRRQFTLANRRRGVVRNGPHQLGLALIEALFVALDSVEQTSRLP